MFAIFKKELRAYFINPVGFVYTGVFLAASALICMMTTLQQASYSTASYFQYMLFTFIILIPLLTMRMFSEERKSRTEQLLLTAPISITGMVLGKYFAALTMFVSGAVISTVNFIPLYVIAAAESGASSVTLSHIGPVTGQIVGCFIAIVLLGAALIAVGTLISALTENQLSAAVITIGVIAVMVLLNLFNQLKDANGQPLIASYAVRFVIDWVSVLSRYMAFSNGLLDWAALVYYVSIAFIFLFLTVRVYEKRRWG